MPPELKPYWAYKDSGVEWLGAVPAHWDVRHLGRFGRLFKGGGGTKEDERESGVPCVRYGDLYTQHQFFITATRACVTPELANTVYTPIRYGDVLFAGSGETIDEIGKSAVNLVPGPACCGGDVIILRPSIDADARFLGYAMDCAATARQKACIGRGFTVVHIYSSDLKYVTVAMPSLLEQAAIVRFLDHADRRIRRYIRAKQKLIALLEEQKQVLIHDAVTGRIDVGTGRPYSAYKPCGVLGLAEVPKDWKLCRLRNVVSVVTTGSRGWSSYASDTGPLFIRVANLSRGSLELRFHDEMRLDLPSISEAGRTRIEPGDLLVSVTAYIGSVGVAPKSFEEAYVSQHVARCQPLPDMHARWLGYVLLSTVGQNHGNHGQMSLYGGTKDGLALDDVKNYPILLPPRHVQDQAVRWIEGKLSALVKIGESTRREIAMVGEYRARLVADVVTGKLDVREAAAGLPDVDSLAADDILDGGNATHDASDSETEVAASQRDAFENLVYDERSGPDGHEVPV